MKWNSLPTSAIYAPVCKQNFQVGCIHSEPKGLLVKNLVFYSQTLGIRKRDLQVRYIHAGIGADSLFDLHNQILTLKETIMSLKPLVEENDDIEDHQSTETYGSEHGVFGSGASYLTFDEMEISSTDYQKLREEYNKLIFQKHKV